MSIETIANSLLVEQKGKQAKVFALLLALTALLLSVGFLIGDHQYGSNYTIMLELISPTAWSFLFFTYALLKLCYLIDKISILVKILASVVGTWLWTYILFSFIVFDTNRLSPAELLIILPLACEVGELVLDIFNFRCKNPSLKRNPSV